MIKLLLILLATSIFAANMEMAHKLIVKHEGFRSDLYSCANGYTTIGYGLNLSNGISKEEAYLLMSYRINKIDQRLRQHKWYRNLPYSKRSILIDLNYNVGYTGLLTFKKMIYYLKLQSYTMAAKELKNSKWYRQTGQRGKELVKLMKQ